MNIDNTIDNEGNIIPENELPLPADAEMIAFMNQTGTKQLKEKLAEENGEAFCLSYIKTNCEEHKITALTAIGWLEQTLDEV